MRVGPVTGLLSEKQTSVCGLVRKQARVTAPSPGKRERFSAGSLVKHKNSATRGSKKSGGKSTHSKVEKTPGIPPPVNHPIWRQPIQTWGGVCYFKPENSKEHKIKEMFYPPRYLSFCNNKAQRNKHHNLAEFQRIPNSCFEEIQWATRNLIMTTQ